MVVFPQSFTLLKRNVLRPESRNTAQEEVRSLRDSSIRNGENQADKQLTIVSRK